MTKQKDLVQLEIISSKIHFIRNEKVLLDRDLATLYGVETRVLKQAVRRNIERFPKDFMFTLNKSEFSKWRSQIVTSNSDKIGLRHAPMAFTEQGVTMLSSVLNSDRAIKVNIAIMRAFVKMREYLQSNEKLARKLNLLEKESREKSTEHQKQIGIIFEATKQLMKEEEKLKRKIGY